MLTPQKIFRPNRREVAARLRQLEIALNKSPSEIADEAGIARNAWSQYRSEKGKRLITLPAAYRLTKFGVTLDWIYSADMGGLKFSFVQNLNSVPVPIVGRIPSNSQDDS